MQQKDMIFTIVERRKERYGIEIVLSENEKGTISHLRFPNDDPTGHELLFNKVKMLKISVNEYVDTE